MEYKNMEYFGDLRPLVRVPVHSLWHYSANFIGFKYAD